MPRYRYLAVPFEGQLKAGSEVREVSSQLTETINRYVVKDGWEFHSLEEVRIAVAPGCLAAFLGISKMSYTSYNQLIFRKERHQPAAPIE